MNRTYLRGDIYFANLGTGVGSEQEGSRPVLIIQNDTGNKFSPTVIVAAISSKVGVKAKLPTHYYMGAGTAGLEVSSIVLLEQLRTVDKLRLERYIGRLGERQLGGVNHALAVSLDLINKIPDALIMCLCHTCADNFRSAGGYALHRVNRDQNEKDTCDFCNVRRGFDYEIIAK
ncbi:MAG: type II toxin-antitoxin system PemK/MazF family toxin [Oscillospiraceae bacterium]|nr:type II toxin-antitoxin system PemK/MazF family toxin [Oscillospiraceae bacterium]